MRTAKPWYRSTNDTWYVWHRGQQIPLAKGKRSKRDAEAAFHQLMAAIPAASESGQLHPTSAKAVGQSLLVAELLDQFLDWVKSNLDCFDRYQQALQKFADGPGALSVERAALAGMLEAGRNCQVCGWRARLRLCVTSRTTQASHNARTCR